MSFLEIWRRHDFAASGAAIRAKTTADVRRALGCATVGRGLGQEDLQSLLSPAARPFLEEMAQLSHRLTVERFGRTMQLFAPMYLSNVCANVCSYCGFSAQNRIPRKVLSDAEILADAAVLKAHGFDHVLLVTGESGRVGVNYLANALRVLREKFSSLSIEVQPLDEAEYAALVEEGLSAVLVYQETYDAAIYPKHHVSGPKSDMRYRLETPDRLGRAGVKKIGLGALFGLSDWRADAWFTGMHLRYLERTYWKTRYSLSFPRLRPHEGGDVAVTPFDERDLVQAVCAFRLFSQEVELSLSTRECEAFRDRAFRLGFTTMSAGSRTNPGGYASAPESLEQFEIDDARNPAEVAAMLRGQGYEAVWKDWDATYDGRTKPAAVPEVCVT
ncbi:2-iminoacetate synthase ThiH [Nibricoccus aquaticus]|uniref:2-iminoacetate synthase ThiH n=1 Tax=Nibricoccus aquaticus TaxID=2576891 RepID=A0A290QBV9_9BACT|nr:2-iminoacetate synthase ThiH [Nibricoccus aquaticus]ATC66159.1 2-iminoacetate synthase ThiH [Nibricoccus aquaticus]